MQLDDAKKVLKSLHDNGLRCAIAGGFARDTFFGLEPKDVDIIVFGFEDREAALKLAIKSQFGEHCPAEYVKSCVAKWDNDTILRNAVYTVVYDFTMDKDGFHVLDTFSIYHSKKDSGDCLVEGHKFGPVGIDVLVYQCAPTLVAALDMFDYNLSQFALVGPELIPEYLGTTSLTKLEKTRMDMETARRQYIEKKYESMRELIEQAIHEGRLF